MSNILSTQEFRGEWLNDIPTDWDQSKIKHLFSIKKEIAGELGHDVISITQRGAKLKDTVSGEGQLSLDYSKYQLVSEGDFLMNHMDLLTGYLDISKFNGVTSPDYRVFIVSNEDVHPNYYLYLFQHGYKSKIFYGYGRGSSQLGRWRFPTVEFEDFYFPVPPIEEQKLISPYLDKMTSQIDSLVEKIQKKIELLKEQRTSLINHYVTKGLDSNVEMKDSGVEWIGEIPKHWKLIKFNILCENISNGTTALQQVDFTSFPVSRIETISGGVINPKKVGYVENTNNILDQYLLNDNDILFSHINSFEVVGQSAIYREALHGPLFHGMNLLRIIPKKEVCLPDYLHKNLQSSFARHFIRTVSKHAIGQVSISISNLSQLRVPIPPLSEQHEINRYLETKIFKINQLIDKENQRIKLFSEYRQSLISSVVTGKVRVTEDMI